MKKCFIILGAITLVPILSSNYKAMSPNNSLVAFTHTTLKPNTEAQLVLDLVNQYRTSGCNCGTQYMPPTTVLTYSTLLEKAAQKHSLDMFEHHFFAHIGSDGSTLENRINQVNYNYIAAGENIVYRALNAEHAVKLWINSPGHCKNIMNPKFNEMGLAFHGNYWTQVLGKAYPY